MGLPRSIQQLSEVLGRMPGVGPKMSARIALYLSVSRKDVGQKLYESIQDSIQKLSLCTRCFNVTEEYEICAICQDDAREKKSLLIVETPLDLYSIEDAGIYTGLYHVLHGVISPVNGIGPDDIRIQELVSRLDVEPIEEIVVGLNPTIEGDSTALFIKEEVSRFYPAIRFSKLAQGIPSGGSLEFMSSQTIKESFQQRVSLE